MLQQIGVQRQMQNAKFIVPSPIIFQESIKIDESKFLSEFKKRFPRYQSLDLGIKSFPNETTEKALGIKGNSDPNSNLLIFKYDKEGYLVAAVWNLSVPEESKSRSDAALNEVFQESYIEGKFQKEIKSASYETLTEEEKALYDTYENFRTDYEAKLVELRKLGKPIFTIGGEAHNYATSRFLQQCGKDISVENGFANITQEERERVKNANITKNQDYTDRLWQLDSKDPTDVNQTYHLMRRVDKATPDINIPKVYMYDLPPEHPIMVEAERGNRAPAESPEGIETRNNYLVEKCLLLEGDTYHAGGAEHLTIAEREDLKNKYSIIPIKFFQFELTAKLGDTSHNYYIAYANGKDSYLDKDGQSRNISYSSGKPMHVTIGGGNFGKCETYLKNKMPSDYIMLSRKFSKIYEDKNGGHQRKLEDFLLESTSDKDDTVKVIDAKELEQIRDYVFILKNEFGKAIELKQSGNTLSVKIGEQTKNYTLKL